MKKIFTMLFMALGIYSVTHAQTKNQTEFGVSFGVNSAYVTSNAQYGSSTDLTWNPNFAVSADHFFTDQFSIKAKAIYDPKGWNGILTNGTKVITGVDYSLKYITVPVTFNLHFGNQNIWYIMGGPYVGFLLSAKESYYKNDLKSSFNSTDAGADLGFGVNLPLNKKLKIFFEYDGQFGLTNILANSSDGGQNMRSSANVGIRF
ncbi:MAG: porin family protein [Bacteroidota bacterium]|jgi:hypothetical protein